MQLNQGEPLEILVETTAVTEFGKMPIKLPMRFEYNDVLEALRRFQDKQPKRKARKAPTPKPDATPAA